MRKAPLYSDAAWLFLQKYRQALPAKQGAESCYLISNQEVIQKWQFKKIADQIVIFSPTESKINSFPLFAKAFFASSWLILM